MLKSIKNDIDLIKTKETANRTEKTPTGAITIKVEANEIKTEANEIETDGNLLTNKKKGARNSEKKKSANFDFCK